MGYGNGTARASLALGLLALALAFASPLLDRPAGYGREIAPAFAVAP